MSHQHRGLAARTRRTRPWLTAVAAAGVASACALSLNPAGASSGTSDIDRQVDAAHDDLANANEDVNRVKAEVAKIDDVLSAAQAKYDAARQRSENALAAVAQARAQVKQATGRISSTEVEIEQAEKEIAELRAAIGQMARQIYAQGGSGFEELQIILESEDPADFAARVVALERVAHSNDDSLAAVARAQLALETKLQRLEQLRIQLESAVNEVAEQAARAQVAEQDAEAAKAEVEVQKAQRQKALKKADAHRAEVEQMYAELVSEQRRIAREAAEQARREAERQARLEAERRKKEKRESGGSGSAPSTPAPPSNPGSSSSVLSWPLPGYSAGGRTGPRIHPVYGYRSCHTGVDMGAPSGVPIRSAADGVVLSTNSGGAYGLHTMISHGNGLVTMYAHQSRFAVGAGQSVSRGQVIGYVGSTGFSTGPHLHFEVHVNGVPHEPMGWFGGSKHRVTCW